jgi:hypothetical protein
MIEIRSRMEIVGISGLLIESHVSSQQSIMNHVSHDSWDSAIDVLRKAFNIESIGGHSTMTAIEYAPTAGSVRHRKQKA